MNLKAYLYLGIFFLAAFLLNTCSGGTTIHNTLNSGADTTTPPEQAATPTIDPNPPLGFPRIANLWGLYSLDLTAEFYANFDLLIPYYLKEADQVANEIYRLNPDALILHTQYGTKGREELDSLIHEWWVSEEGDPGYPCLLRDSSGSIVITETWEHPMVNLINPDCRKIMADKNIQELKESSVTADGLPVYTGIYWDLLYDRISWLGDDIDSNLDGIPDEEAVLDEEYKKAVVDFLVQIRQALPQVSLMGNEASIDYAPLINGRLFEWQIPALLDGLELYSWDEIIENYRTWSESGVEPRTTIIQNAPEESLTAKYGTSKLEEIPAALLDEAASSFQRMRFGLTSALMGDGFYSFDLGKMWHGQFWWYDEFGRMISDDGSTSMLPDQGYLGQPVGDPYVLESSIEGQASQTIEDVLKDLITSPEEDIESYDVWARKFENGMAIVNPTSSSRSVTLDKEYCRLNGTQAPLFQVRVDDDETQHAEGWVEAEANLSQFGETVHVLSAGDGSTFTYSPNIIFPGDYEVLAWIAPSGDLNTEAEYRIVSNGGTNVVKIDQTQGEPGWRSLGIYTFAKGNQQGITLYSPPSKIIIADAIKWVSTARFNDGSRVTTLVIQPYDGIILVDCCLNEAED